MVAQRRVSALGVVAALDEVKDGIACLVVTGKLVRSIRSHSSVAKKLSHLVFSKQSPTDPIDGRTPASRAALAELDGRVLTTLIGVMNHFTIG